MPDKTKGLTEEQKGLMLVLLGIVAVVAIVALVLLFTNAQTTGRVYDASLEEASLDLEESDDGNELTGDAKKFFKKRKGVSCLFKGRGWTC
ncbi:MAG: hypothetical protein AABX39_05320 [Nanoarchaeota archaeon]